MTEIIEAVYRGFIPRGTGAKAVYQLRFEVPKGQLQTIVDVFGEYLDNEPQWVAIAPIHRVPADQSAIPPTPLEEYISKFPKEAIERPKLSNNEVLKLNRLNDVVIDKYLKKQTLDEVIDADQEANDHVRGEIAEDEEPQERAIETPVRFEPTTEEQLNSIESDPAEERRQWTPPKNWGDLKYVQRYGILCKDERFQEFLCSAIDADEGREGASEAVKVYCGISSGSELSLSTKAAYIWTKIEAAYRDWTFGHRTALESWELYVNEKDTDHI